MKIRSLIRRRRSSLVMVCLAAGVFLWSAEKAVMQESRVPGVISGRVTASAGEVRALRVKARDTVNRMTYTVFTSKGRYEIFNLPASTYEVQVFEPNFNSPVQKVDLRPGDKKVADLALTPQEVAARTGLMEYDELYPPGAGRDILERECMGCHTQIHDFFLFPRGQGVTERGRTEEQWRAAYERMINRKAFNRWQGILDPPMVAHPLSAGDRDTVMRYLAQTFPPGHQKRGFKLDTLTRDEEGLSRAVFVQYDLPPVEGGPFADGSTGTPGFHDAFVDTRNPALIWLSATGSGNIISVDTRNLNFATRTKQYRVPTPERYNVRPHGIVEARGLVYSADIYDDHLTELNPATGEFRRYAPLTRGGGGHTPRVDSKGNVYWTTVYGRSRVNRLDAVTKQVTEFNPIQGGSNYYGIVIDKKDRVYVAPFSNGKAVPMYDPQAGTWTLHEIEGPIRRIAVDPKGRVWGSYFSKNGLVMVDPDSGKATNYELPLKYGNPYDIWSDNDGNIWLDVSRYNSLVRFEPATQKFTYFPFPVNNGHEPKMDVDPDGTLWFSGGGPQLSSLKPKGNIDRGVTSTTTR